MRDLAAQIESPLFLAHVRATSLATVQETNCHPFRHRNWLFVHNGEIDGIEKFRRELLMAVDPAIFEIPPIYEGDEPEAVAKTRAARDAIERQLGGRA